MSEGAKQDASTTADKAVTSSPTPVFGSSSTFGAGSGFSGFKGVEASKPTQPEEAAGAPEEGGEGEEDCSADFKPLVQLSEVESVSGEEAEAQLCDFKCKLYRFDKEGSSAGEWKERGVGQVRLLEHKQNHKIRLLMRQEKTLKIRANHIVMPGTKLTEHIGSDKAWVWSTMDFASEVQKMELFCIRFASKERALQFKEEYEKAMAANEKLLAADDAGEEDEGDAAGADSSAQVLDLTDALGKVNVQEPGAAKTEAKSQPADAAALADSPLPAAPNGTAK